MSKVSVIVPIYNSEKTINRCVESIINQTYKDIEILLINDGSIDNTLNILNDYANKDKRIVVINKKNEGVSKTKNLGIKNEILCRFGRKICLKNRHTPFTDF